MPNPGYWFEKINEAINKPKGTVLTLLRFKEVILTSYLIIIKVL